jgi:hypothetical protein
LEACADSYISEVLLGFELFLFSFVFLVIELHVLPFDAHESLMLHPKAVDISNDSSITQVEESIVDNQVTGAGGVEDGEVSVFDPSMPKVGMREGVGMQWCPI